MLAIFGSLFGPAGAVADNPSSGPTFAQLVFAADTVAVVTVIAAAPDGSATIRYDRVYKGVARGERSFPADNKALPLTTGSRVLLLEAGGTLDFRGNQARTIDARGNIDVRDIPGAPRTLAELDAYFTPPETDTVPLARDSGAPDGLPLTAAGTALLGLGLLLRRRAAMRD